MAKGRQRTKILYPVWKMGNRDTKLKYMRGAGRSVVGRSFLPTILAATRARNYSISPAVTFVVIQLRSCDGSKLNTSENPRSLLSLRCEGALFRLILFNVPILNFEVVGWSGRQLRKKLLLMNNFHCDVPKNSSTDRQRQTDMEMKREIFIKRRKDDNISWPLPVRILIRKNKGKQKTMKYDPNDR